MKKFLSVLMAATMLVGVMALTGHQRGFPAL